MGSSSIPRDPQVINLNHTLASQERLLLSSSASSDAFKSRYERARIRANFDYARSLLLTVSSTKQLSRDDVQRKRDLVKRLQARLNELDHLYADEEDLDCDSCDEEGQQVSDLKPPPQAAHGIRQRSTTSSAQQPSDPQATTTSSNRYSSALPPKPSSDGTSSLQNRERKIASQERERDDLQASLLNLAKQLKTSVQGFGSSMESEKGTLDATVLGLDKSMGGMEGAGGKMKQLQRETEGAGWFRRMRLYAEVAGLWVLVVLLVFVFPKLRFSTW